MYGSIYFYKFDLKNNIFTLKSHRGRLTEDDQKTYSYNTIIVFGTNKRVQSKIPLTPPMNDLKTTI